MARTADDTGTRAPPSAHGGGRPGWHALAALLAVAAATYLPFLGARDLWAPDEPRYAEVAREMVAGDHWWRPHVNGHPYPDKPPLYFWLAAAAGFGDVTEAAARLPSVALALVLVGLTWDLGRRTLTSGAAFLGALALATCWLVAWMARRANLDVPLAATAVAAIWATWRSREASGSAGSRRRVAAWAAVAGVSAAIGVMIKGPVVLIFVAAAILPLAVHAVPQGTAGERRARVAAALGAFAVVLAAWLVPARLLGDYQPWAVVREHVLERAAVGRDHAQPPWYYLVSLPADFLPWTVFALPAAIAAWRQRAWRDPAMSMLLAWATLPVLVLSFVVEKRNVYLLPCLPAWGLLVGSWIASLPRPTRPFRLAVGAACAVLAVLGLASLGGAMAGSAIPALRVAVELPGLRWALAALGTTAFGAALATVIAARRRRPLLTAGVLGVGLAATHLSVAALLPALDPLKSGRAMGEQVAAIVRDAPLGMLPRAWDTYVYYSGRTMTDLADGAEAAKWLDVVPRPAFLLAYEADLDEIPLDGAAPPARIARSQVGHRTVVLLRYGEPSRAGKLP